MRAALVCLIMVGMVFAGCVEDPSTGKGAADAKKGAGKSGVNVNTPRVLDGFLGHNSINLSLDPTELFPVLPTVSYVSVGRRGPEPSIGVTKNGMIFFQAIAGSGTGTGPSTMRSDDGGKTWKDVAMAPFTAPTTLDPFLWVDQDTDRVFVNHLYVACSYLSMSDNYGQTWVTNPVACGLPGNDHQKIGTGKFRAPLMPTPAYKNVVYYAYNGVAAGSRISMSFDGGITWPLNTQTVAPGACSGGLHGRVHTGPDGWAYVPKRDCGGFIIAASDNNGVTWTTTKAGVDVGSATFRKNPELAVDTENNLYMVWPGNNNRLYLSISKDHGKTWSQRSLEAAPPEVTTTTMPSVVAGGPGRIAYAYYGVYQGNGKNPECVGTDETWDLFVTWSLNALDDNPTFVTTRANALDDPVQIGGISTNSGSPPADCKYRRNLLDFIDLTMDKEGRVYVATADGCIDCKTQESSSGSMGMASVQLTGPSLLPGKPDFLEAPKGVGG